MNEKIPRMIIINVDDSLEERAKLLTMLKTELSFKLRKISDYMLYNICVYCWLVQTYKNYAFNIYLLVASSGVMSLFFSKIW